MQCCIHLIEPQFTMGVMLAPGSARLKHALGSVFDQYSDRMCASVTPEIDILFSIKQAQGNILSTENVVKLAGLQESQHVFPNMPN